MIFATYLATVDLLSRESKPHIPAEAWSCRGAATTA